MSTDTPVTVLVTCRVLVQHVIVVTVEVEQSEDLSTSPAERLFDYEDLQALAVPVAMARMTVAGTVEDRAASLLCWEAPPSQPGEPWRPYTFGGRIG